MFLLRFTLICASLLIRISEIVNSLKYITNDYDDQEHHREDHHDNIR